MVNVSLHQFGINSFMNYSALYTRLIESRQRLNRQYSTYCGYERHHILPKSLGGSNKKENLVVLTPREHCLAHMILAKMYEGEQKAKMCFALISLAKLRNKNRQFITSREYDRLRRAHYAALQDPDYKAWRSAITKAQWTPERRAAVSAKTKEQWINGPKRESFSSDAYRKKKSEQMKERWQNPAYIKEQSDRTTEQWKDPSRRLNRAKKA